MSAETIVKKIYHKYFHIRDELGMVIYVDASNRVIDKRSLFPGTANKVEFPLDSIMYRATSKSASGIWIVHNHPSGNEYPSKEDLKLNKIMEAKCSVNGMAFHGHILFYRKEKMLHWKTIHGLEQNGSYRVPHNSIDEMYHLENEYEESHKTNYQDEMIRRFTLAMRVLQEMVIDDSHTLKQVKEYILNFNHENNL